MSGPGSRGWVAAAGALLVCTGCGFKGPLYLPERNGTVITHPGQGAPSPSQTQAPGAQAPGTQAPGTKGKNKAPAAPPPPLPGSSPPALR